MATKPKAKPEAAAKATPKPALKSAPIVVQKAATKTTPSVPAKANKVAVASKIAVKVTEKPKPNAPVKSPVKVNSKPEPKTASKTVKPETVSMVKPTQKAALSASATAVPKAEVKKVEKTASTVVPKSHKWQEIRDILEKIKEDTLREISKSVKNGTDAIAINEPGGDIYDQASSERDRELGLLLGDREREKLHSIDEALLRISENEYGICEECDEDIPLGRLKAMPFTRHCVKCKSDLEKLQAQTKRFEEDRAYREIPLGSEEEEA
jgi:DnaK suppressor protein